MAKIFTDRQACSSSHATEVRAPFVPNYDAAILFMLIVIAFEFAWFFSTGNFEQRGRLEPIPWLIIFEGWMS